MPGIDLDAPPRASRGALVEEIHGVAVADPYRGLEDLDSAETRAWVRAQDTYTRSWVARSPSRRVLERSVRAFAEAEVYSAPLVRGGRSFFSRAPAVGAQGQISVVVREGGSAVLRTLVDRARWEQEHGEAPSRFVPSPDGELVALASTAEGEVWETVRVLRVDGELLPDRVSNVHQSLAGLVWSRDGRGFYYQSYSADGRGAGARVFRPRLRYHRLGTASAQDLVVYDPGVEDLFLSLSAAPDGDLLILSERLGAERGNRILVHPRDDPSGVTRPLIEGGLGAFLFGGQTDSTLWFRTDLGAPNGRVVAVDSSDPERRRWREVIPEGPEPISTWVGRTGPLGVVASEDRLIVTTTEGGRSTPTVYDLQGEELGVIPLPYAGSLWSGIVPAPGGRAFFVLSGLVDPGTVYAVDLGRLEVQEVIAPEVPLDIASITTSIVHARARDGERIPVHVVRRRDTALDGTAPLVLYGYGFGGWNAAPYYYPAMAAWVARGGIWAVPTLRGDGGYGSAWHHAGRRHDKATTILDYVDVARWLAAEGYAASDSLVANTSSAGGAVVAAALVAEPQLFAAAILDYPLVDVLRYHRFGYGQRWIAEYGSADQVDDFTVLYSYSAYHRVRDGDCYPALLAAPGENDGYTPPLHAYKLVAALQAAQSCEHPILLRVSWGAGHNAGADVERSIANWVDQLAFLDLVLPERARSEL